MVACSALCHDAPLNGRVGVAAWPPLCNKRVRPRQGVEGNEKQNIHLHKMLHEQKKSRGVPGSDPKRPIETKWKENEGSDQRLCLASGSRMDP